MKAQVATTVSPESGMLLKTIGSARGGRQPGSHAGSHTDEQTSGAPDPPGQHLGLRHPGTMTWCFRIRVNLRPTSKLQCEDREWIIDQPDSGQQVKLAALATTSLAEARRVALRGEGYATEAAAVSAGQEWRARLMKAFLPLPVGADFGDRAPHGSFTEHGLAAYAPGQRALNDVHGLMVFECEPAPVFISMDIPAWTISSPHESLVAAMAYATDTGGLSEASTAAVLR